MDSTPVFHIPTRLRGIPLVSDTPGWRNEEPTTTTSTSSSTSATTTSTSSSGVTLIGSSVLSSTSSLPVMELPTLKSIQLDKRHAEPQTAQTNSPLNGLLFQPNAMTASTSNTVIKKTTVTTTTKRPKATTTTTTTTKRPTTTTTRRATTTTTRRPLKTTKQPPSTPGRRKVAQLMTMREVPVQNNVQSSTTPMTTITTTKTSITSTTTTKQPATTLSTTTTAKPTTPLATKPTTSQTNRYSAKIIMSSSSKVNLTRATQTLNTQPDFQRRTQQTVGSPRFINRPNGFAGENWVLFNQPGGQLSFFETMTLISSILMVSTVLMVFLYNWFKSFHEKKRNNRSTQSKQNPPSGQQVIVSNQSPSLSQSPAMASTSSTQNNNKISTLSGNNLTRPISGLSSTTLLSSSTNNPITDTIKTPTTQVGAVKTAAPVPGELTVGALTTKGEQMAAAAEGALQRTISSEIKAGAMNVANKAMAIVQPTENNETAVSRATNSDSEAKGLKENQRLVNRSVSDLSGNQQPQQQRKLSSDLPAETNTATTTNTLNPLVDKKEVGERVSALEELFYGSAPNSQPTEVNSKSGEVKGDDNEKSSKNNRVLAINNSTAASVTAAERLSASSLESIELPEPLVESIKRAEARNPTTIEPPSPNPLLAEVHKDSSVKPMLKVQSVPESAPPTKPQVVSSEMTAKSSVETLEKGMREKLDGAAAVTTPKSSKTAPQVRQDSQTKASKSSTVKPANANNKNVASSSKSAERPANPMSKLIEDDQKKATKSEQLSDPKVANETPAQVMNHQIVVNKLDKRKSNLEIVDIRDESVTGKMRNGTENSLDDKLSASEASGWISMEGVAVVQPAQRMSNSTPVANPQSPTTGANQQQQQQQQQPPLVSPSEIIEGRFNVDYNNKKKLESGQFDSIDSKQESLNNIEDELEADNKLRNRKYFVYIVQDGHFTAKKECIARIELPQKRRITLAEVRHLIANSRDISLSSLRRNKFKFVTETYRLLNENEDAAVLHQVYPTQGVFLKLNIPDQETQAYQFKSRSRLSSGSGNLRSSVSQTTIASRRRATSRGAQDSLPAIEVDYAQQVEANAEAAMSYGRTRASSVGRQRQAVGGGKQPSGSTNYRRSKSNVQTGMRGNRAAQLQSQKSRLPPLDSSSSARKLSPLPVRKSTTRVQVKKEPLVVAKRMPQQQQQHQQQQQLQALGNAASDLGTNVISGVKQLFNSTFRL